MLLRSHSRALAYKNGERNMSRSRLNDLLTKLLFIALTACLIFGFILLGKWKNTRGELVQGDYLPMIIGLAIIALCVVVKFILNFTESAKDNPDKGVQLLLIGIYTAAVIMLWWAYSCRWPVEYMRDVTYSGSSGIGTVIGFFGELISRYPELVVITVLVEIALSVGLTSALSMVEKKYVKTLYGFITKLAIAVWAVALVTGIMNTMMAKPTSFSVMVHFYFFNLSLILIAPAVKMFGEVCLSCYGYKFGTELISSQKIGTYTTYEQYDQGSTSFETSDGTKHTIKFVGERAIEHNRYSSTYRCNGCGSTYKSVDP